MDHAQKKKPSKSDAKSKKRKTDPKNDDVSSASTSCEKNARKPIKSKVNGRESGIEMKKQATKSADKKKSARSDAKRKKRNYKSKSNEVSRNVEIPEQLEAKGTDSLHDSSLKTPTISTPRSSFSTRSGEKTPCSFYKVTQDEEGKPVFSKSLLKYFFTVDSPEMDDLKNKRWNTSFLRETPKPNREIKIFTEEEDSDPKYFENVPDIDSNMPDIPGSLFADVFTSMPINESDEELKKVFKDITPVKGPNGKKKRKSTRISCYNGKPFSNDSLLFDYSDLIKSDICFEDNNNDSKENIIDIKVEVGSVD